MSQVGGPQKGKKMLEERWPKIEEGHVRDERKLERSVAGWEDQKYPWVWGCKWH